MGFNLFFFSFFNLNVYFKEGSVILTVRSHPVFTIHTTAALNVRFGCRFDFQ